MTNLWLLCLKTHLLCFFGQLSIVSRARNSVLVSLGLQSNAIHIALLCLTSQRLHLTSAGSEMCCAAHKISPGGSR